MQEKKQKKAASRWLGLDDAVLEGEADHLDGGRETEFVEDIGLMRVHGADGDMKLIGDLLAEFAGAASLDDLKPSSKTSVLVDFSYFTFPFLKISEGNSTALCLHRHSGQKDR